MGSIPGSGRSLEKEMTPHSSILPGKSHGKRSLAGPWIPKSQTPLSDYRTTTSLYISKAFYSFLCQSTFHFAVTQTVNQPNTNKNVKKKSYIKWDGNIILWNNYKRKSTCLFFSSKPPFRLSLI